MSALIGKKCNPINRDEDVWKNLDEAEDAELLDSNKIIFPEKETFQLTVTEASPPPVVLFSPNILKVNNAVLIKYDNAGTLQNPPSPLFCL